jgi:hypothetical protein
LDLAMLDFFSDDHHYCSHTVNPFGRSVLVTTYAGGIHSQRSVWPEIRSADAVSIS